MRQVYLDNNATTPIHPEVQKTMIEAMSFFGNASSFHGFGRSAREEIEKARASVAKLIGCDEKELVFTSGGSESNNLAIKGRTCFNQKTGNHVITSQIEHPSVLNTCKCLETLGHRVTYVPCDKYGMVDPADVEKAISDDTVLITIMMANNEVGTIQPIAEIGAMARKHDVYFHTDAVQAAGKIPVDVNELNVDFLSLSGHKLHGPKGIGAAFVRKSSKVCPLIQGGHQERNIRAGTENTLGIMGLGKAAELAMASMDAEIKRQTALREMLYEGIKKEISDIKLNGHPTKRLPGTLNISFHYVEGESILMHLDFDGIAVSTGSACTSGTLDPSHVLMAMGMPEETGHSSMRFSFGRENTEDDIKYVLEKLPAIIQKLRAMSPLTQTA